LGRGHQAGLGVGQVGGQHLAELRRVDVAVLAGTAVGQWAVAGDQRVRQSGSGGLSLEKWIFRRRLEGARNNLAAPTLQYRTIEAVARS
jgi:hypothetical protein